MNRMKKRNDCKKFGKIKKEASINNAEKVPAIVRIVGTRLPCETAVPSSISLSLQSPSAEINALTDALFRAFSDAIQYE
jgi:hypothetical protein